MKHITSTNVGYAASLIYIAKNNQTIILLYTLVMQILKNFGLKFVQTSKWQSSLFPRPAIRATYLVAGGCVTEAFWYYLCSIYICRGLWGLVVVLFYSSVAESWVHKLGVRGSTSGNCQSFYFPLIKPKLSFKLMHITINKVLCSLVMITITRQMAKLQNNLVKLPVKVVVY